MIVIIGAILGALIGGLTAYRRKGTVADILQYTVIYALAFALVCFVAYIILVRVATGG